MRAWHTATLAVLALAASSGAPRADGSFVAVPVPLVTVHAGEVLTAPRIGERRYRESYIARNGFARARNEVAGLQARRTLVRGRPIPPGHLEPADLVRAGETVDVVWREGALAIRARLVALNAAGADETVRLRNGESGRIVEGRVGRDGAISVRP